MTDRQVYERAVVEIQRCQQRIEELRAFIRVYEEFAGTVAVATRRPGRSNPGTTTTGRKPSGEMQDWERMVDAALQQAGKPLRVREIYDAIVAMGFHVESDKPVSVLDTRLRRTDRFQKIDRGLYARAEKPNEEPLTKEESTTDQDDEDDDRSGEVGTTSADELSWGQAAKGA